MEKLSRNRGGDARGTRAGPLRAERLKAALKANLARRKDQARRREAGETGDSAEAAGPDTGGDD